MHTIADIIPKNGEAPVESGAEDNGSLEGTPPLSTGLCSPLVQPVTEQSTITPTPSTIPLQTTLPSTMTDPTLIRQALLLRQAAVDLRQQLLHPILRNYQLQNNQLPNAQLPQRVRVLILELRINFILDNVARSVHNARSTSSIDYCRIRCSTNKYFAPGP